MSEYDMSCEVNHLNCEIEWLEQENEQLKKQLEEAQIHIERLRDFLGKEAIVAIDLNRFEHAELLNNVRNETPKQSLARFKSDAVREAKNHNTVSLYTGNDEYEDVCFSADLEIYADQLTKEGE